jgi:hypothetical protein
MLTEVEEEEVKSFEEDMRRYFVDELASKKEIDCSVATASGKEELHAKLRTNYEKIREARQSSHDEIMTEMQRHRQRVQQIEASAEAQDIANARTALAAIQELVSSFPVPDGPDGPEYDRIRESLAQYHKVLAEKHLVLDAREERLAAAREE